MIDAAGEQTHVVFYFAGHGSRVLDEDGDELDGYDEMLLPWDSAGADGATSNIVDDELSAWFSQLAGKTEHVVAIFDCCHSGTVHRGAPSSSGRIIARYLPGPVADTADLPDSLETTDTRPVGRVREQDAVDLARIGRGPVYLFACSEEEEAAGLESAHWNLSASRGLFTLSLERALATISPGARWMDLLVATRRQMQGVLAGQHPRVLGASQRLVFDGDFAPVVAMPVSRVTDDGLLEVAGGTVHGLAPGAVLRLHDSPPIRRGEPVDPQSLQRIERLAVVERVLGPGSALARLTPRTTSRGTAADALADAKSCVDLVAELHEGADPEFVYAVMLGETALRHVGERRDEFEQEIAASPFLHPHRGGESVAKGVVGTAVVEWDEHLGYRAEAQGGVALPHPPRTRIADERTLARDLHAVAAWRSLRELSNRPPALTRRCEVRFTLGEPFALGSEPAAEASSGGITPLAIEPAADGVYELKWVPQDQWRYPLRLEVHNRGSNPLFVWIVDIEPHLGFQAVDPHPNVDRPLETLRQGFKVDPGGTLRRKYNISTASHPPDGSGTEILKVLVSETPCDLRSLFSLGITAGERDHRPPTSTDRSGAPTTSRLERVLQQCTTGHRGGLTVGPGATAAWMTAEWEFRFVAEQDESAATERDVEVVDGDVVGEGDGR